MKNRFLCLLFAALGLLAGCATRPMVPGAVDLNDVGMDRQEMTAGAFRLTAFSRIYNINEPIAVYIEGDVRGWVPAAGPEADSTPDEYLGLRLAMLDPSDNLIFISRPCQFGIRDPACRNRPWREGRWAEQVYTSMNRALDHLLAGVPHPQLNLVGYSGGGALAAIMAARRHDVVSLRTLAGNMDPDGNGRTHAATPQTDFIDPMQVGPKLATIPQEHFVGDKDASIPSILTESFVLTLGPSACAKITHVPGASHKAGWEEFWRKTVAQIPSCEEL